MFEFGDAGLGVATTTVGFAMGFLRVALKPAETLSAGRQHSKIEKVHCTTKTLHVRFSCPIAQCNQDVAIVSAHEPGVGL